MSVPKYDEMMVPILSILAKQPDGTPTKTKDVYSAVAAFFELTEEDLLDRSSSGSSRYKDNASWAMTYMRQAKLISSPKRGYQLIDVRGREVLASGISKINKLYLSQFPEFVAFLNRSNAKLSGTEKTNGGEHSAPDARKTPVEEMEQAYADINAALASDLLGAVMDQPPFFFEKLVVDLLLAMGYGDSDGGSGFVTKQSGDEGIDGVIREDKLGFSSIYTQAKRWDPEKSVGRPEIQKFAGALMGSGATKGLFITTAGFTKEAVDYAEKQLQTKIILVDGSKLAQLMIAHGVGVSTRCTYEVKSIDKDYFDDAE